MTTVILSYDLAEKKKLLPELEEHPLKWVCKGCTVCHVLSDGQNIDF